MNKRKVNAACGYLRLRVLLLIIGGVPFVLGAVAWFFSFASDMQLHLVAVLVLVGASICVLLLLVRARHTLRADELPEGSMTERESSS